jgi:hypothetical protein
MIGETLLKTRGEEVGRASRVRKGLPGRKASKVLRVLQVLPGQPARMAIPELLGHAVFVERKARRESAATKARRECKVRRVLV